MDQQRDRNDKAQRPDEDPLPIGKDPSAALQKPDTKPPVTPPIAQQNVGANPPNESRRDDETENNEPFPVRVVNDPLLTRVVEDDELGLFEQKTLQYARWGFFVAAVTLVVVVGTGIVFWQQFKEMAAQTDVLSIAARQARRDSAESGIATQKQLAIAQQQAANAGRQVKAAQDSVAAIQRQTEIGARPWIELSEIAMTGGMTINMNGEARSQVYVVARNIGKTPAREVSLWVELGEHYTEHQEIHRLCTMNVAAPKDAGKYGQVLFPTKTLGEKESQIINVNLKPLTLVERKGTGETTRPDKNGPPSSQEQLIYSMPSSVIGCIQYKSFTSDVPYYTGFIYELLPPMKGLEMFRYTIHFDRKTGKASDIPSTITQENGTVNIPLDWMRLTPNLGWGNDTVK